METLKNETSKSINERETGRTMPELSLRELYYHGIFERKLFSVEDVLVDLHNRKIDADNAARKGELDADGYEAALSEIREAKAYFETGVSEAWFTDAGFEKDGEDRVVKIDGEEVLPLPVEKIRESMQAFLRLMRKKGCEGDMDIPLWKVYEAGVFRYGDFTVEEAAVDVHDRLTDAYLALDSETERFETLPDDLTREQAKKMIAGLKGRIAELKEAKAWADSELVKVHFLMADAKKDAFGRYTSVGGHPVVPINAETLRKEYEEYLRVAMRRHDLQKGSAAETEIG